jgi:hypothetical protein
MSDDLNNPNDPLDELLAQARWTEPQRASTERLTESWRQLRRPRYAILPALTAAAAVIAIALVSWHWVTQSKPSPAPQLVERPVERAVSLLLVGRPMTALETTLYEAQMRKLNRKPRIAATVLARSASRTVIVKRIEPPPAPAAPSVVSTPIASVEQHPLDVDAFLARVADPKTRAQALATLDVLTNPPTDQLMTY